MSPTEVNNPAASASPFWSRSLAWLLIGILFIHILLLLVKLDSRSNQIISLKENKQQTDDMLQTALQQKRIGLQAVSMRNEFAGWEEGDELPVRLLEFFTQLNSNIKVNGILLQRPILYRPLPRNSTNSVFSYSLALGGMLSVDLADVGNGRAKMDIPYLLDDARAQFDLPFSIITSETEDGAPDEVEQWRLHTDLKTSPIWKNIPISQETHAEETSDE